MTWRDIHIAATSGVKIPADDGTTTAGGHKLASEIVFKVSGGTAGHLAVLTSDGGIVDGGAVPSGGSGAVSAGTANTLAFYASNGTTVAPLALGTNLSISGTTLDAAGGSGGSTALGAPTVITASGPQTITLAGANTFVRLTNTTGATALTLPNGTTDGQRIKLVVSPMIPAHTLALTVFGSTVTLPLSTPNIGFTLDGYWCQADVTWYYVVGDGGLKISDLTAITTPALTDLYVVTQGGVDYKGTGTQIAALVRKTPAGSRTATLTANGQAVTLTASDHDKTVVATGAYTGITLAADGTVTDGFRCHVINGTGGALTFTSMTGFAAMKVGATATIMLANATLYAMTAEPASFALTDASSITTDASKSDIFKVTLGGNRTLANPTNLVTDKFYTWEITQDGTGSRTLSYGNLFTWLGGTAPTLSTAASAVDTISALYDGTKLRALAGKGFA